MLQYFKISGLSVFMALFLALGTQAHNDSKEIRYVQENRVFDEEYQSALRAMLPWQQFLQQHPRWSVHFNEGTQTPHRAYGNPIAGGNTFDPVQRVKTFMETDLAAFQIPMQSLELQGTHRSKKYTFVNFVQYHEGLEIINSRVTFKLTPNNEIILFGADVFKNIQLSTQPLINASVAQAAATTDLHGIHTVTTDPKLRVLAIPNGRSYSFKLVYTIMAEGVDEEDSHMPSNYECLVDAHDGTVLSRRNLVVQVAPSGGNIEVKGTIFPTHLLAPSQMRNLPHLRIQIDGTNNYTSAEGGITIPGPYPKTATVWLEGRWSRVVSGNNGNITPSFVASIDSLTDSLVFDNQGTAPNVATIRHLSAYYHTTLVHDYMKSLMPNFTALDIALTTRVDRTDGNCNAFFNGNSINFYTTAGGCNALSQVADVIYHEYGHAITNYFYSSLSAQFQNGAMGEGYSDIYAITLTNNPVLGVGFTNSPTQVIRRYDQNPKIFPQNLVGQVHADGEIICGAWWRTAGAIGSTRTQMEILAESMYGLAMYPNGQEGKLYTDILIDALQADDNDNDLTNGTPNINAIINSFAFHGIRLLNNVNFNFTQLPDAPALQAIPINIQVNVQPPMNALLSGVDMVYTVNGITNPQVLPMTKTMNDYSASIPAQPLGTILRYYFRLKDVNNTVSGFKPANAELSNDPALWYNMLVGFTELSRDDAENPASVANWSLSIPTDNATGGRWEAGVPIPSYVTPSDPSTIVQPGTNTTPGGTQCFFTQNAASPNSSVGLADVDGGRTTLTSPPFDLTGMTNPVISYMRWYTNDMGTNPNSDFWEVYIANNGTTWRRIERTIHSDRSWRRNVIKVGDHVLPNATVQLRFIAQDPVTSGTGQGGSIVEAAIDDIIIYDQSPATSVEELNQISEVLLYPNPASRSTTLRFSLQQAGEVQIRVVNLVGQEMCVMQLGKLAGGVHMQDISLENLQAGLYLVEINAGGQRQYLRLIAE